MDWEIDEWRTVLRDMLVVDRLKDRLVVDSIVR